MHTDRRGSSPATRGQRARLKLINVLAKGHLVRSRLCPSNVQVTQESSARFGFIVHLQFSPISSFLISKLFISDLGEHEIVLLDTLFYYLSLYL